MDRLLITGGCGFIGLNLIDFLQKYSSYNYNIIVLDNLTLGRRKYLSDYDVEFVEGDIRDSSLLKKLMKKVNSVIHLAADTRVVDSIANPDFNFNVNVEGTYNLLRAAQKEGVERFVLASTGGAITGKAKSPVNESMAPQPLSPYGASKLSAEGYCSAFAGSYGMKTVSLRFSNVYGPFSNHKNSVVAAFFKNILKGKPLSVYGDGSQTRDFILSEDLCSAIINALNIKEGGEVYQLGSGIETSINTLISIIREIVEPSYTFKVSYKSFREGEIKHNYSDIGKAKKFIGYNPLTNLSEGLKKTWDWFCKE